MTDWLNLAAASSNPSKLPKMIDVMDTIKVMLMAGNN
jgi:hypothetical protein